MYIYVKCDFENSIPVYKMIENIPSKERVAFNNKFISNLKVWHILESTNLLSSNATIVMLNSNLEHFLSNPTAFLK